METKGKEELVLFGVIETHGSFMNVQIGGKGRVRSFQL